MAALQRAGLPAERAWERVLGGTETEASGADGSISARLQAWSENRRDDLGRPVVAAQLLSQELGAPVATVLEAMATHLEAVQEAADARSIALAGPRASIRLLTALPPFGIGLGYLMGLDPLSFLLGGGLGAIVLGCGVALQLVGRAWARRLVAGAGGISGAHDMAVAQLVAAALSAGASIPAALVGAAHALPGTSAVIERAGRALGAGASWAEAWQSPLFRGGPDALGTSGRRSRWRSVPVAGSEVAGTLRTALEPAWRHGLAPAGLVHAHIARVHARARREAAERAAKLGVTLLLPVGLCFLPAFMALAIVPILADLASTLL